MSNESPHGAAAPTALVVEDDEHIATLLKFILEREGFAVVLARDGREAQQLIDTLAPPGWCRWTWCCPMLTASS